MNKTKNRFYIYIYFDPRKPGKFKYGKYEFDYEPFYVGKGTNNRKNLHIYEAVGNKENWKNDRKCEKILSILNQSLKPIIIVYENNIDEIKALKIEDNYIKLIKTIEDGGPLLNLRYIGGPVQETRIKLSKITSKYWNSDDGLKKKERASKRWKKWHKENDTNGNKNFNFGNNWNEEQRSRLSYYLKKSKRFFGKNNPKFKYLYKIKYQNKEIITDSLKTFCEENQLNYDSIRAVTKRKEKGTYKRILYIERIKS